MEVTGMDGIITGDGIFGTEIWVTGAVSILSGCISFSSSVGRSKIFCAIAYVIYQTIAIFSPNSNHHFLKYSVGVSG